MSLQDPISDMLTRIRNAHMANKKAVSFSFSTMKASILEVLKQEGYINSFEISGEKAKKTIEVGLKYFKGKPVISEIKRISKPSVRSYCGYDIMPEFYNGLGEVIVSTSKGVMTGKNAAKNKVGGELICCVV